MFGHTGLGMLICDERGLALLLKLSLLVIRASGRSLMLDVLWVLDGLCLLGGGAVAVVCDRGWSVAEDDACGGGVPVS